MSPRPILLDTCALIWIGRGQDLGSDAEAALQEAQTIGVQVLLSPISAWELGVLVARGRLALSEPPLSWFKSVIDTGVELAALTPEVLVASSFLPGEIHGDPADRILAATARAHGYRLMTRDKALLDYASQGHLQAIAC